MTLTTNVWQDTSVNTGPQFPIIRKWGRLDDKEKHEKYGVLVVLFITQYMGIPLSGVAPENIGKLQSWVDYSHEAWEKCTIELTSKD